jgi:hypothetical protein
MTIKSKMMFVLLGDDRTGKTTIQKLIIEKITSQGWYEKLPTNQIYDIIHPEIKRKYKSISFANRSYQEKKVDYYESVNHYFEAYFKDADIAFVSSHLVESDVKEIIENGKILFFNVLGVFFSNSIEANLSLNSIISKLDWDERLMIENPIKEENHIEYQLNQIADNIITFITNRTAIS